MDRKEQIKRLWRDCFNDSDAFIYQFFERVYHEENAISLEKNGKVISVLQMLPYTMMWYGKEIPVSYIYAACTDAAERGKGLMAELIDVTHKTMRERGFKMAMLIPASNSLFEFYRNHSYTEVFDITLDTQTPREISRRFNEIEAAKKQEGNYSFFRKIPPEDQISMVRVKEEEAEKWFPFFDRKLRERPMGVLHDAFDFVTLIRDNNISGGFLIGAINANNEPRGLAFTIPAGGQTLIKEILADNEEIELLLIKEAMKRYSVKQAKIRKPVCGHEINRMGMGLILDRENMINDWLEVHPDTEYTKESLLQMNTADLTRLLMDYKHQQAYMSLMMD